MPLFDENAFWDNINGAFRLDAYCAIIRYNIDRESDIAVCRTLNRQITGNCVALSHITFNQRVRFRLEVEIERNTCSVANEVDVWHLIIIKVTFFLCAVYQSWLQKAGICLREFRPVLRYNKISDLICVVTFNFILVFCDSLLWLHELFLALTLSTVQKEEVSEGYNFATRWSLKLCLIHH